MADETKLKFKDARTARELVAQLRSDAALIAIDIQVTQMHYCLFFASNVGLVSVWALAVGGGKMAIGGVVLACVVPFITLVVVGSEYPDILKPATYAFIDKEFAQMPVEESLERLVIDELIRIKSLFGCRKIFRTVNVVLAIHLAVLGAAVLFGGQSAQ